jgi:hypothetical protein
MTIELKIKSYVQWGNSIFSPDCQFILSSRIIYTFQPWRNLVWSCEYKGSGIGIQAGNHSIRHIFKTIRKVYEN